MNDSSTLVYGLKKMWVQVTISARENGKALIDFRLIDPAILLDGGWSLTSLTSSLVDITVALVSVSCPNELRSALSTLPRPKVKRQVTLYLT